MANMDFAAGRAHDLRSVKHQKALPYLLDRTEACVAGTIPADCAKIASMVLSRCETPLEASVLARAARTMAHQLSGRLLAAARALAGIGVEDLARASGVQPDVLHHMEAAGAAWLPDPEAQRLGEALEVYGVVVLPEADGMGAGLRLKFTRQDVRQIVRLEGEGGPPRSDDVP